MERQNIESAFALDSFIIENTPERIINRYHALSDYALNHDFGILDEDVVVVDTETTGFSFNHDELIQIAAARMVKGDIVGWYVTFVNPGKAIPDDVAHLTNIHDDDVVDAPDPDTAVAGLVEFIGTSDVVAHNAQFDRTFCTKYPSGEILKQNRWIDSLDLARIALPRLSSHRLLDLVRAFGGPDSTHRADDDVYATCLVYRVLLAAVASMPPELVAAIARMATVEEWNTVYIFQCLAQSQSLPEDSPYPLRSARKASIEAMKPTKQVETNELVQADLVDKPLVFPTDEEITEAFSSEGLMGSLYADYEPREEQRSMALAVNKALRTSHNLAVEAGTGVGKSMAYLVPMALAARKNHQTMGVATKTNALLDQLVHKELPLLRQMLGITYAPLKGFTHYPCLRKIEQITRRGPEVITYKKQDIHQAPALAGLLSFIEQTNYDDMDALKIDYRAIPRRRITTSSAECLRRKCPFFGKSCFVHGARERAEHCDIVVTNHSLLFWDVRFEGGLLPPIKYWTVDEAHGAEAEARRAFSLEVSSSEVQSLALRLTSDSPKHNVLLRAARNTIADDEGQGLYDALVTKARTAAGSFGIAAQEYCLAGKDLLALDDRGHSKGYDYFDLWLNREIRAGSTFDGVKKAAQGLYDTLEKLIAALRDIVALAEEMNETSSVLRELALCALELRELYDSLEENFFHNSGNHVYSVRLNRSKNTLDEVFSVQPIDMGAALDQTLYQDTASVIYASATLTVDGSFSAFEQAMGLNAGEESQAEILHVDSSFDFNGHMRVFVPSDLPEPQDPQYVSALSLFLSDLHVAQHGSFLTLFTNRREMERCYDAVNPVLKEAGLRLVCQKWGVSVKGLRDDFLKDEHLSLFALKSFWEGFDAPGSTLKGVIVPRLPFGLPTDPLSCERKDRDDHAWAHYVLPAAVIDVRQAVGRLIRTAYDTGVVVLTDRRLITKGYGKKFLRSLPTDSVEILPSQEIITTVKTLVDQGFYDDTQAV